MLKRPLCFIAMAFVAAVFVFLKLYPPSYIDADIENGEYITISGTVTSKETGTDFDGNRVQVLYIDEYMKDDTIVKVYLSSSYQDNSEKIPQIGEQVKIKGQYYAFGRASNPGEFDSRVYYKILKIEYQLREGTVVLRDYDSDSFKESLYRIRSHFAKVLEDTFEEEDASVMKAMLLGDRTSMDDEIKSLYQGAGIIHILSISGLHISILGMGLYNLLRKCRMKIIPAAALSIALMMSYGIMCGMGTSAVRAIIMFILHMIATVIGRTYDMLTGIAVSAVLIIIMQPLYIYHSGFLMSFGAVIGIGMVLPVLSKRQKSDEKSKVKRMDKLIRENSKKDITYYLTVIKEKVIEGAASTVKASLSVSSVVLPVQMNTYYTFSVYSVFLNILVIPFMTILLGLGIMVLGLGSIASELVLVPGFCCHIILALYKSICTCNRMLPGNTWYAGHADAWQVVLYYAFLIIFILFKRYYIKKQDDKESEKTFSIKTLTLIYLIPVVAIIILSVRIRPKLRMTFLHVGQGDGIVIEMNQMTYLIDGGSTSRNNVGKYVLTPYLKYEGIGYIDACIITHEDKDHISGVLELLEAMPNGGIKIGTLILPDCPGECRDDNYQELEKAATNAGVKISYIKRGDELVTGRNDISITCIGPRQGLYTQGANAHSTVLFLKYGEFSSLLTGDVEAEGLSELNAYMADNEDIFGNLTLLKVPHHGSRYTTDEEFLEILDPACAVISAGYNNMYGHPHGEVLKRLREVGADYYITYETGAITLDSDGKSNKLKLFISK